MEARFSIKVTGPVNSEISTKAAPAILNITAFRVQDNTTCPAYDCLALEALVDDDDLFSNLSASWRRGKDTLHILYAARHTPAHPAPTKMLTHSCA